jgi:hypothetical protein
MDLTSAAAASDMATAAALAATTAPRAGLNASLAAATDLAASARPLLAPPVGRGTRHCHSKSALPAGRRHYLTGSPPRALSVSPPARAHRPCAPARSPGMASNLSLEPSHPHSSALVDPIGLHPHCFHVGQNCCSRVDSTRHRLHIGRCHRHNLGRLAGARAHHVPHPGASACHGRALTA